MVIFGWGPGKQEDLGQVAPCVCPNCRNQVFLHHVRSKKSVSLYFVPVVPYGTDEYMVCPVCSRGLAISKAQLPFIRSMAGATASFRAGRLNQAQYMAQVERFWGQMGVSPAGQQVMTPASPGAYGVPPQPAPVAQPPPVAQPQPVAQPATPPGSAGQPLPGAADEEPSWIKQLRKLAELHDQGVLSDDAYQQAKQRILEQQ